MSFLIGIKFTKLGSLTKSKSNTKLDLITLHIMFIISLGGGTTLSTINLVSGSNNISSSL